jgi:hypothetical protein
MNIYAKFFLLIGVLILFKILNRYLISFVGKIQDRFKEEKLMYGLTSRHFLSQLSFKEFEEFCSYYLTKNNYANITNVSEAFHGGLSLICSDSSFEKVYVSCIKSDSKENNNNDDYKPTGRPELQKFIGGMVHDKILSGIVITNGDFSKEAMEYVNNLPEDYNIELIDGINLSKACWEIRKKNIMDLSLVDVTLQ